MRTPVMVYCLRKMFLPVFHKSRAFTLIELLVVIAIIGVLAAIAIPAYSGMQAKAAAATCSSNLRQMVVATQSFAGDNNGKFPALVNHPWDEKGHIADLSTAPLSQVPLLPFGIALAPYLGFEPVDTSTGNDAEDIPKVFICPGATRNKANTQENPWLGSWPTYRYNSYAAARPTAAAKNLTKAMLFIDAVWPGWSDACLSSHGAPGINIAYADGHIAFLPLDEYRRLNPATDYQGDLYRNGWFLDQ
jgi:prepilin-type N-terminal cleavage/methylation domain-containing protein/prepilin-type processing-associated H-X9-DG protein